MGNKKVLLTLLLSLFFYQIFPAKNLKIGIFDTTHLESYRMQPFIDLAKSVDFSIDYKSFAQISDSSIEKLNLDQYDGIFFDIGIEFLKGMAHSPISHKILQIIQLYGKKSNKLIGLFLPPVGRVKLENKAIIFAPLFTRIGLNVTTNPFQLLTDKNENNFNNLNLKNICISLNSLSSSTKRFLDIPFEARSFLYHKTLSAPQNINFINPEQIKTSYFTTLPIKQNFSKLIKPTLPYGLYFFNPLRKNYILIGSNSLLSFSGISESFHICPIDFDLRKQIHEAIQEMLWELKLIITQNEKENFKINFEKIEKQQKPVLPKTISNVGTPIEKNPNHSNNLLKKTAWTDLVFIENEKSETQQDNLIQAILKSGNDLSLWITLNPQMYYSPKARLLNKKEIYWKTIKRFTKNLKTKANKLGVKTPKILIGYEITNNIYEPNLPKQPAVDLYGNEYFDVPAPLDKNFWDTEIKNPLETFLQEWNKPEIGNGIEIAGIVLDLEMYCRRTTGAILATMGFRSENLQVFNKSFEKTIALLKAKKLQKYFEFLENQAELIGKDLRNYFRQKLPECLITCYAPNISIDWFYKGLYKGLGTPQKPVQLLTFNSEFASHQKWLKNNGIFANHSSVLMLSKIKNKKDFWWINHILKHNHGIWFNKYSRFAEEQHNSWMNIEQSQMSKNDQLAFFDFVKTR